MMRCGFSDLETVVVTGMTTGTTEIQGTTPLQKI